MYEVYVVYVVYVRYVMYAMYVASGGGSRLGVEPVVEDGAWLHVDQVPLSEHPGWRVAWPRIFRVDDSRLGCRDERRRERDAAQRMLRDLVRAACVHDLWLLLAHVRPNLRAVHRRVVAAKIEPRR